MEKTKELVKEIYNALDEKKAEDIQIIDIAGLSVISDYFVVANATNSNQLQALQDAVNKVMYEHHVHAGQIEGNRNSTWILMDYGDILVHLFSKEDRLFYNLERIWKDGKFLRVEDL